MLRPVASAKLSQGSLPNDDVRLDARLRVRLRFRLSRAKLVDAQGLLADRRMIPTVANRQPGELGFGHGELTGDRVSFFGNGRPIVREGSSAPITEHSDGPLRSEEDGVAGPIEKAKAREFPFVVLEMCLHARTVRRPTRPGTKFVNVPVLRLSVGVTLAVADREPGELRLRQRKFARDVARVLRLGSLREKHRAEQEGERDAPMSRHLISPSAESASGSGPPRRRS